MVKQIFSNSRYSMSLAEVGDLTYLFVQDSMLDFAGIRDVLSFDLSPSFPFSFPPTTLFHSPVGKYKGLTSLLSDILGDELRKREPSNDTDYEQIKNLVEKSIRNSRKRISRYLLLRRIGDEVSKPVCGCITLSIFCVLWLLLIFKLAMLGYPS